MRFGLLGPPVVHGPGGEPRTISSAKVRALLAALLLEPNRVVSVETLKEALWEGAPPVSAHASLHNHVTRLRRLIGEPDLLRSVPPGYLLRVADGDLDTQVFDARAAETRAAHARRDWPACARAAAAALELWRGDPVPGVADRLAEVRLLVREWGHEADLHLGRAAEAVPHLHALAAEHPLREAPHRLLMLALHKGGRQAEALGVHAALRARLIEELGVEPGADVRRAHREILAANPSDPAPGPGGPGGAGAVRPAQLPPAPARFTGREETVRALREALSAAPAPGPADAPGGGGPAQGEASYPADPYPARPYPSDPTPARPRIAVLSGMAGVGKSALALHVAHALAAEYPDGQLYLQLHGATRPLPPAQALATLLHDLGVASPPADADAAAALLRTLLAPTRTLLVLDDAGSAAQVRPLLPAGPGCAVVVTSRSPLTALDGAARFPLQPLSREDSAALLRAVSGREFGGEEARLAELCGHLPLALRVVAARLAARSALSARTLAGLLDAEAGRLDHLEYDDLSVRRSLAVAHEALAPEPALALRRIGALCLPAYGPGVMARLMDTGEERAASALDRLADLALIEETAYGRFVPHDLVRDFARELARRDGGRPGRGEREPRPPALDGEAAADRVLRWCTALAREAARAILPESPDRDMRLEGVIGDAEPFADAEAAYAWGDRELAVLAVLAEERAASSPGQVLMLIRCLFPYLQRRGRTEELRRLNELAVATACRLGDPGAEAQARSDLAAAFHFSGRAEDSLALVDETIELWRGLGRTDRVQRALGNRGMLLENLGRYEEAAAALEESGELARGLGDLHGESIILSHLGNLTEHSDPSTAILHHTRSLELGARLGFHLIEQSGHCNLGYAYLALGEPAAARDHFDASLTLLARDVGDYWHGESQTRLGLVRALRALDLPDEARLRCEALIADSCTRADSYMSGLARHQLGHLLHTEGRREQAYEQWRLALTALDGRDPKVVADIGSFMGPDSP